jgi:diguanylate cyclase (GGDEF)-like protein
MGTETESTQSARLQALRSYAVLDTPAEQAYDDIVTLASLICGTPMALISLVDEDRQWFKARVGMDPMETPRGHAFCAHAIVNPEKVLEIQDASKDVRFADNPLVTGGPRIRFYAGAPLLTPSGSALGTVCVMDHVPRVLTPVMEDALRALSRQVSALLALRRANVELELLAKAQWERQGQLERQQHKLEALNADLVQQSQTDGLTGLINRRAFDRLLREELSRAQRGAVSLALLMVDVDHFKSFNDDLGHVAGDDALKRVAHTLTVQARNYDHVARYGGEEFALVLPEADMDEACAAAERIRSAIEAMHSPQRTITVSVGVALSAPGDTPEQLIKRADKALYQAKGDGRNRVAVHGGS